jgi:ABC-type amino acid transport substrate-binding protein
MIMKGIAAALAAAAIAVTAVAAPPAAAQTGVQKKKQYVASRDARTRVVVTPRSFLDAGTEVRPGERKFTDYAFPPNYPGSTGVVTNMGGKVGWDRSPFTQPYHLPGFSQW